MHKLLLWLLVQSLMVEAVVAKTSAESKPRLVAVDSIVLHAIGGPYCKNSAVHYSAANGGGERWIDFFATHKVLGIHYVIDRRGRVFKGISENKIANHTLGWNQSSIGIELVNNGDGIDVYPKVQVDALVGLLRGVLSRHPEISKNSIVRHSDADVSEFSCGKVLHKRKSDPGAMFDLQYLLDRI